MGWFMCLCLLIFFLHSQFHFSTSSSSNSSSPQLCRHDQSVALLQFKNTFSFDPSVSSHYCDKPYPKMKSWKEGSDCCSWDGVTCDWVTGHVIGLNLSCSWLNGTIHSNSSLFLLSHLQWLDLDDNDFYFSPISPKFGRFAGLTHLNLSFSVFSGLIPSEISHLSKLVSLDLSGNYFCPPQPRSLKRRNCQLETRSLKRLVQNLTELRELSLNSVNMSLVEPGSLMNLSSSLTSLDLGYCGLQGNLPGYIFQLPNLQMLRLNGNSNLVGYFPNINWSISLKILDFSYTSFSGEVSGLIGNLKHLNYLDLYGCQFSGSIPKSLGNLTQITHLGLYSENHFINEIPSSLSNLGQLSYLRLSGFNFNAQFPALVANLTRLVTLYLSNNTFWGPLPPLVLPNLMDLDLSYNSLNGTIPSWVFTLPSLSSLDLTENKFSGHIPEFQNNSLEKVYLNDNELRGPIPRSFLQLVNLTDLSLSSNNFSGILEVDEFLKFKNLAVLDLSYNSLSLSTNSNNVTSTLPNLSYLGLASCNLSEFPYFLTALENLVQLDLSNNKIHGEIPKWVWDMGKDSLYYLNLSSNLLTGVVQLPWKNLILIDLHSNLFQGPLPVLPLSTLVFSISNNHLTGKIPSSICNVSQLKVLDLSNNSLIDTIPECLGNFSDSLSVLDLRMNSFHGTIPGTFAKGNSLRTLNFDSNQLEGPVPQSLLNCSNLKVLDLGNNKIRDTFPNWLDTLPELRVLVLRSNRFHGVIGDSKTRFPFPKLRIIDLSHNEFIGLLPASYFKNMKAMMNVDKGKTELGDYMRQQYYQDSVMVTMKGFEYRLVKILAIFTTIDLSNNTFWGQIPKVIGNLNSLKVPNLSHNNLAGQIPPSLGNLTQLESLDLSSNKLDGGIPLQLTGLTFLAVFNLSHNHLVGLIPRGKQFDTFENNSYNENLGLCGFPLSKKCGYDEAPEPLPSNEKEDDSEFAGGFGWKAVMMGYGCGMIFGLIIGFLIFFIGKPGWFVRLSEGGRHKKVKRSKKSGHRWAD